MRTLSLAASAVIALGLASFSPPSTFAGPHVDRPIEMQQQNTPARPALPRGGEWYKHDQNRACWTYRIPGSGHISSPFLVNGEWLLFRRGAACDYSRTHGTNGARIINMR